METVLIKYSNAGIFIFLKKYILNANTPCWKSENGNGLQSPY
jgi:hypothetical protein